ADAARDRRHARRTARQGAHGLSVVAARRPELRADRPAAGRGPAHRQALHGAGVRGMPDAGGLMPSGEDAPPLARSVAREAAHWLMCLHSGQATEAQRLAWARWRSA